MESMRSTRSTISLSPLLNPDYGIIGSQIKSVIVVRVIPIPFMDFYLLGKNRSEEITKKKKEGI